MSPRLALPPSARREEAVDVGQAARILGCDPATERGLVRCEAIEGHRVGKTDDRPNGVRVNLYTAHRDRRACPLRQGATWESRVAIM